MKTFKLLIVLTGILLISFSVQATTKDQKVIIAVDLATPVMEADKRQTAFIKISLTGFKQDRDSERIPANVAIVLDKSGSMRGLKLKQAKEAAIMAINRLNRNDIVAVITYDTVVDVIVPALKVSDHHSIARKIRNIRAHGNTALFAGVSKGAQEVRKFIDKNKVNRVILLSDGLANVGPNTPSELGRLGLSLGKEGISVTTIGLGLGYNEDLMTKLAGYSDGNHAFVENASQLGSIFQYEFGDVLSVVAQSVHINIECADGVRPIRILGRDANIIGNRVSTRLNQLYSEQEKYLILEVEVPPQAAGKGKDIAMVDVSYNNLYSKNSGQLTMRAHAKFSHSQADIKKNINTKAYEASVEQVVNERRQQAVLLRDAGKLEQAKREIQKNVEYLDQLKGTLTKPSIALEKAEQEAQEDSALLEDKNWNRSRKVLKAKEYRKRSQQSY